MNYGYRLFLHSSLREQMGLVGQEPVLFNMTIAENIRFSYPQATMVRSEAVCGMSLG